MNKFKIKKLKKMSCPLCGVAMKFQETKRDSDFPHISGDAWILSPIQIQGTRHFINESQKGFINIGCIELTIKKWMKAYKIIGKRENYTKQEIEEYGEYIKLIDKINKIRERKN